MAFVLIGRFDIYGNPGKNKTNIPYLIDLQSSVSSRSVAKIFSWILSKWARSP